MNYTKEKKLRDAKKTLSLAILTRDNHKKRIKNMKNIRKSLVYFF